MWVEGFEPGTWNLVLLFLQWKLEFLTNCLWAFANKWTLAEKNVNLMITKEWWARWKAEQWSWGQQPWQNTVLENYVLYEQIALAEGLRGWVRWRLNIGSAEGMWRILEQSCDGPPLIATQSWWLAFTPFLAHKQTPPLLKSQLHCLFAYFFHTRKHKKHQPRVDLNRIKRKHKKKKENELK